MKDYIKEFRKQKSRRNTLIVLSSLAFAFSLNAFVFFTPVWNKLQTSVKNYSTPKTDKEVNADIYLKKSWTWSDIVEVLAWSKMNKVSVLSFSLVSDSNSLKINDIFSDNKNFDIVKTTNVSWIYNVIIKFKTELDINKNESLLKIVYTKIWQAKTSINLAETQFKSWNDMYELQSNSIEF